MAKASDRWTMAELHICVPALTSNGRDALVRWLRERASAIEKFECMDSYSWNQPNRKYRLKVGY
jgi:hypothetical protein